MPVYAQTSLPHNFNALSLFPNTSVHYQPTMSNPVVSHIHVSGLQTNFVPLPRTTLNQIGGPYQGAATADTSQGVASPDIEPRMAEPNIVPTERATFSQVPPAQNFFPKPQAVCSQALPTSHEVPPNANTRPQGAW
jgi:hypothetical protein